MELHGLKTRKPKCAGRWYPFKNQPHSFIDNPVSSAVISPHAGFAYSGLVSLEAVSYVKKNRIWIFGTSHYEMPFNGISIFYGDYSSSIGKALFPRNMREEEFSQIKKYFSDEGHRTEEHSIENVLFSINHFKQGVDAFCVLVGNLSEPGLEKISADIANVWNAGDSIVVSTDWNHFVSTNVIGKHMAKAASYLERGNVAGLYESCKAGELEACGIDGLYLAHKILSRVNENTRFKILTSTNSAKIETGFSGLASGTCVGYLSARN